MASETIYDHPRYYDILFGFDRSKEAEFYHRIFSRCGVAAGEPVLEVGAGPARVARLLARRGWRVTALDHSAAMLALAREEAAREAIALDTLCADMTAFSVERAFAAAYNPLSSFRLLHSDAEADAHLRCLAAALRPGGVYVLDLAFLRTDDCVATTDEGWEMTHGAVTVRGENDGVTVTDSGVERRLAWGPEAHLRGYTATSFATRVAVCPELALESWHPEVSRATGVSEFSVESEARDPIVGRAMVVLRRKSSDRVTREAPERDAAEDHVDADEGAERPRRRARQAREEQEAEREGEPAAQQEAAPARMRPDPECEDDLGDSLPEEEHREDDREREHALERPRQQQHARDHVRDRPQEGERGARPRAHAEGVNELGRPAEQQRPGHDQPDGDAGGQRREDREHAEHDPGDGERLEQAPVLSQHLDGDGELRLRSGLAHGGPLC
jgi:SAM-dependent methyltransferase